MVNGCVNNLKVYIMVGFNCFQNVSTGEHVRNLRNIVHMRKLNRKSASIDMLFCSFISL